MVIDDMEWLFGSSRMRSDMGVGPAYFGERNDIAAEVCLEMTLVYTAFSVVVALFVLAVITARRRRVPTAIIGSAVIANFFAIVNGFVEPKWFVGRTTIISTYCMFNPDMFVEAEIGLNVGLNHFNVTYTSQSPEASVHYNDRFDLVYGGRALDVESLKQRALRHGLPNPVVVVAEYMETSEGGFEWGRHFPSVGYYTATCLYCALVSTISLVVSIVVLPLCLPYLFLATGAFLILANVYYWIGVPSTRMDIVIEGTLLDMHFGQTYFIVLVVGIVDVIIGGVANVLKKSSIFKSVSTFLELDFDTPWDNRVIKEDSAKRREEMTSLTTKVFVDSRLRVSVRRFRDSVMSKRRAKSQDVPRVNYSVYRDDERNHGVVTESLSTPSTGEKGDLDSSLRPLVVFDLGERSSKVLHTWAVLT